MGLGWDWDGTGMGLGWEWKWDWDGTHILNFRWEWDGTGIENFLNSHHYFTLNNLFRYSFSFNRHLPSKCPFIIMKVSDFTIFAKIIIYFFSRSSAWLWLYEKVVINFA
jgi:hypothetical protein